MGKPGFPSPLHETDFSSGGDALPDPPRREGQ